MSPTGNFAVVTGTDRILRVFDLNTGSIVARGMGHSELVTSVKFTLDGSRIISTSADGCIFIWRFGATNSIAQEHSLLFSSKQQPRDFDNESVDFDSTPESVAVKSSAKRVEGRPFSFGFTETALPTWARSPDIESDVESKTSEMGKRNSKAAVNSAPAKGRWAQVSYSTL